MSPWNRERHVDCARQVALSVPADGGRIEVVTEAGQLIGVLRFRVVETSWGAGKSRDVSSAGG